MTFNQAWSGSTIIPTASLTGLQQQKDLMTVTTCTIVDVRDASY